MLIEFSVENFLSFRDRVTLSMVAGKDDYLPNNVIKNAQGTGLDLLKSCAIYGPNASGKTNLVKAMEFMEEAVNKFDFNPAAPRFMARPFPQPFKLDHSCLAKPSSFEMNFLLAGVQFHYGFSMDNQKVQEEYLSSFPTRKPRMLFKRLPSLKNGKVAYKFGPHWKDPGKELLHLLQPDTLFLSVASQFRGKMARAITAWFQRNPAYYMNRIGHELLLSRYKQELYKNPQDKNRVMDFLKNADVTIENYSIDKWEDSDGDNYKTLIYRQTRAGRGRRRSVSFELDEESKGTRKLFAFALPFITILNSGNPVVMDELDVHLHPNLTSWLISLFNSRKNDKGAQLIFTTHDSSLLDPGNFRRDQIWFADKGEEGATKLYSLWDFRPREDKNVRQRYLSGRYGAVPFIDEFAGWESEDGESEKKSRGRK